MHLKLSRKIILRKFLLSREFLWILTPALKSPSWSSEYWTVPFSDEALQIGGLFHQGHFPYCSGYEARRVQHFPDFNLEGIFITKNILTMKNPTDFGKRPWKPVWIRACPIVLLVTLQQLAIVRLNVSTYDCESRTFFVMNFLNFLGESRKAGKLLFET